MSRNLKLYPFVIQIRSLGNAEVKFVFCDAVIINDDKAETRGEDEMKVVGVGEVRVRRQTSVAPRGRYRGQTQSQYLAVDRGGKDEGKAEAHSAADSSRASVSE